MTQSPKPAKIDHVLSQITADRAKISSYAEVNIAVDLMTVIPIAMMPIGADCLSSNQHIVDVHKRLI